jgi:hypothetical protein
MSREVLATTGLPNVAATGAVPETGSDPSHRGLTRHHWFVPSVAVLGWHFDAMDQHLFLLARTPAITELVTSSDPRPAAAKGDRAPERAVSSRCAHSTQLDSAGASGEVAVRIPDRSYRRTSSPAPPAATVGGGPAVRRSS